jgi:hypothetical protein
MLLTAPFKSLPMPVLRGDGLQNSVVSRILGCLQYLGEHRKTRGDNTSFLNSSGICTRDAQLIFSGFREHIDRLEGNLYEDAMFQSGLACEHSFSSKNNEL